MIDKLIILSDIHGNLSALEAVIYDFESKQYYPDALALLGDNINYGMRPNQVINKIKSISNKYRILVNLFGNHEKALFDYETDKFSTKRGKEILDFTRNNLNTSSIKYLKSLNKTGREEIDINGKSVLFIHGDIKDTFWGKLDLASINDIKYSVYDYVISGHSHIPHLIEYFYTMNNPKMRNKKRTIFLNPGSVGQPRNQNPEAQYLFVNFSDEIFHFNSVSYDIKFEQSLYNDKIDSFYSERLTNGI